MLSSGMAYRHSIEKAFHFSKSCSEVAISSLSEILSLAFFRQSIKDHLGNVRVAYTLNSAGTALVTKQVDSYYPFGMNIRELT